MRAVCLSFASISRIVLNAREIENLEQLFFDLYFIFPRLAPLPTGLQLHQR